MLLQPEGGGDRNAIPFYLFRNAKVINHFLSETPLRGSSMRSLGSHLNVLAIESAMDDLARASGQDTISFRLRHLDDARAREVVEIAASRFGWNSYVERSAGYGRGFAFSRYKNLEAWCAIAAEIQIDQYSGRVRVKRMVAAVDTGQPINPDGIRNQVEGGMLQALSWTLFEEVKFDRTRVTSIDWSSYPILRFADVPESLEVHVIDRPGDAFFGVAEAGHGPADAALANAIRDAIGVRLYELPFTAAKIKRALGSR